MYGPFLPTEGPTPTEAALLAAMGCTTADVATILRMQRQPHASLETKGDRSPDNRKVLTKIHLRGRIRGDGVLESSVKLAIDLSTEKQCSVGVMLQRNVVEWVNTYEILPSR